MNNSDRWAITTLLVTHLVVGAVAAWIGTFGPRDVYSVLGFMSLVGAQALLLGIWAGLSSRSFVQRIAGLLCGSGYITCVGAVGSGLGVRGYDLWFVSGAFVTASAVGAAFLVVRQFFNVSIATLDALGAEPSAAPSFSIAQMLSVTTSACVLLGCGHVLRSLGGESLGLAVLLATFVGCGCTVAWLVVWSTLGQGTLWPRVCLALVAGGLVGLLPPFYLGGPSWRFLTWPGLILATEAVAMVSLVVVRRCGYRMAVSRGESLGAEPSGGSLRA